MSGNNMQLPDQINKQAAAWFTLMQSADVSAAERQELRDWLSEHPDHQQSYRQIELVWQTVGSYLALSRAVHYGVQLSLCPLALCLLFRHLLQ